MIDLVKSALLASAEVKRRIADTLADEVVRAGQMLVDAYRTGNKAIIFGNGGSAADAQHFAAELVGRFGTERRALPALALNTNTSSLTCIGNDYGYDLVFARQIEAFTRPGDVAVGISTSGNSPNVLLAMQRARDLGAKVIGLSGRDGGRMPANSDVCLTVPDRSTPRIQEAHIALIHIWCEMIDRWIEEEKA